MMKDGEQHRDQCEGRGNRSAARPPAYLRLFRVLRSIDMVLPFCCARCVAAKVRRVHKRAMKDDVKVKAKKHRAIQTGMGPVEVRRAKVRDRGDVVAEEKIRFTSSILPKWARRTRAAGELPAPTPTYFFNSPPREVTMHRRVFLATTVAAASAATLKAGPEARRRGRAARRAANYYNITNLVIFRPDR